MEDATRRGSEAGPIDGDAFGDASIVAGVARLALAPPASRVTEIAASSGVARGIVMGVTCDRVSRRHEPAGSCGL